MPEEKKEPWLSYLALSTVILAVCATLATFKGGGYSTRSVLAQSQASDMWAHYQAKSIKGYMYEIERARLALELKGRRLRASVVLEYYGKMDAYGRKVETYGSERAEIEKKAKALESTRDLSQRHSQAFGTAVIFLQIAILMSSIAALLKKKKVWMAGLLTGAVGLLCFANGFLLFL